MHLPGEVVRLKALVLIVRHVAAELLGPPYGDRPQAGEDVVLEELGDGVSFDIFGGAVGGDDLLLQILGGVVDGDVVSLRGGHLPAVEAGDDGGVQADRRLQAELGHLFPRQHVDLPLVDPPDGEVDSEGRDVHRLHQGVDHLGDVGVVHVPAHLVH